MNLSADVFKHFHSVAILVSCRTQSQLSLARDLSQYSFRAPRVLVNLLQLLFFRK